MLDLAWSDDRLGEAVSALDAGDPMPAFALVAAVSGAERERAVTALSGAGRHQLPRLRELTDAQPYRPERWLLLGACLTSAAWAARGAAAAERTTDAQLRAQRIHVAEARGALRQAAALDRSDPVPWSELVGVALGAPQHASELKDAFAKAVAIDTDLYQLYSRRLTSLTRKWYGSQSQVLAFAREQTRDRPDGDPRHALIALAHIEGYIDGLMRGNVVTRFWRALRYFAHRSRRAEIDAAGRRLLAGPDSHSWSMAAHQAFAALYHQAGRPESARPHLQRGGPRPAVWPWSYFGDPAVQFTDARRAALLTDC